MTSAERTTHPQRSLLVRCLARCLGRFGRDENGATAVEFSLVALPFFALMWAILETALAFFAAQALETAVGNSARFIRTGQAQQAGMSLSDFKQNICDQMLLLIECSGLQIDVRTFPDFDDIVLTPAYDEDNNLDADDFDYLPGGSGEITVVRAYYEWPVYVNRLGNDLATLGNGNHLIAGAAAFRNEPFPW